MKKISFILFGAAVAFASCTPPAANPAAQQAHIDSIVNEFLDAKKVELQKVCNDNIMAAANDSAKVIIEKAKKGVKVVVHHAPPKAVVKHVEPTKPATVGNGKPSMTGNNTNSGTVGNGKPSMTTNPAKDPKAGTTTVGAGKPKM
jgi:hypothetical protein